MLKKLLPLALAIAFSASALAAPTPDSKPAQRPRVSVRCTHNNPIGPTGAAMANPISIPLNQSNMVASPQESQFFCITNQTDI